LFCHQRSVAGPTVDGESCSVIHPTFQHTIGLVDWCRYVVGNPPTSVLGVMHYTGGDSEDYRMMSLDFSPRGRPGTGPTAQISCGRYIPEHWQEAISYRPLPALQVSCEKGIAFVDLPSMLVWFDEAGRHQELLDSERPIGEQLMTRFFRSVTSLVRKTSDLEDAYLALSVVQAARESHEQGRRIDL
jgi:predicted dehydrogenase